MKKLLPLLGILLLVSGCNSLQKKEQLLSASGFKAVTPTTPAQIARVQSLPKNHITPITKNGKTLFVLPDAKKNCLYVGNQSQYQAYQQLRLNKQMTKDELGSADLNKDAKAEWNSWSGLDTPLQNPTF